MSRNSIRLNIRLAKKLWGEISHSSLQNLVGLIEVHALSVASGDLLYLRSGWYVTHSGLLVLARRSRCAGIHVQLLAKLCDSSARRWSFRATFVTTTDW